MMTVLAPVGPMAGYSASKAAAHSITQALRAELRDRGITVLGAYPRRHRPRHARRRPGTQGASWLADRWAGL